MRASKNGGSKTAEDEPLKLRNNAIEIKEKHEFRNQIHTKHILNALEKKERAFFAPGAAHFIGEKGILSLLEQQGVTISRIPLD